jgi:hypothetical protein
MDASPMWQEFDKIVISENDTQQRNETYVCNASADCLLDEWIWKIEPWAAADSPLWSMLTPRAVGKHVASLVSGGNRLFEGAARMLAASWSDAEESGTSAAGEALLARAGAIEAADSIDLIDPVGPIGAAEDQIVELPSGTARF